MAYAIQLFKNNKVERVPVYTDIPYYNLMNSASNGSWPLKPMPAHIIDNIRNLAGLKDTNPRQNSQYFPEDERIYDIQYRQEDFPEEEYSCSFSCSDFEYEPTYDDEEYIPSTLEEAIELYEGSDFEN